MFDGNNKALYMGKPSDLPPEDIRLLKKYAFCWRGLILGLIIFVQGTLLSTPAVFLLEHFYGNYLDRNAFEEQMIRVWYLPWLIAGLVIGLPLAICCSRVLQKMDILPFLEEVFLRNLTTHERTILEEKLDCVRSPEGILHNRRSGFKGLIDEIRYVEFLRRFYHLRTLSWLPSLLIPLIILLYWAMAIYNGALLRQELTRIIGARETTVEEIGRYVNVTYVDEDMESALINYIKEDGEESDVWTSLTLGADGGIEVPLSWQTLYYDETVSPGGSPDPEAIRLEMEELQTRCRNLKSIMEDGYIFDLPIVFPDHVRDAITQGPEGPLLTDSSYDAGYQETLILPANDRYYYVYVSVSWMPSSYGEQYYLSVDYRMDNTAPVLQEAVDQYLQTGEVEIYQFDYDAVE